MNVFWLAEDHGEAARAHCDQHVIKMLSEYAQILGEALAINGRADLAEHRGYESHPCCVWAAESRANYSRLMGLADELWEEKLGRFGGGHKSYTEAIEPLPDEPGCLPDVGPTERPLAMPDEYERDNVVAAYRDYYVGEKLGWARYRHSEPPEWIRKHL